jgi:hypothetical protein
MNNQPEKDLLSLRDLSYALGVDSTTIRRWIKAGKIGSDLYQLPKGKEGYRFERDSIEQLRVMFSIKVFRDTGNQLRQAFTNFAKSHHLTRSYKPVLLKALFKLVNQEGIVEIEDLVREFREFYTKRISEGLPVETGTPFLQNVIATDDSTLKNLIVKYPLDRFMIKGFLQYYPDDDILQISPLLWQELRYSDVLEVLESAEEQLRYYYNRNREENL